MANNCNETFLELQELQQKREALIASRDTLHNVKGDDPEEGKGKKRRKPDGPVQGPQPPDPSRQFLYGRDPGTGQPKLSDLGEMDAFMDDLDAAAYRGDGAEAVDAVSKPLGREGQFENLKRLIESAGEEGAAQIFELTKALVGKWSEFNPEHYARVTSVNSAEVVAQRVMETFAEGFERADMGLLTQSVMRDAAPFTSALQKQTRVLVMDVIARDSLIDKLTAVRDQIKETGLAPDAATKAQLAQAAETAIATNAMSSMVRRVSGQLLQQLQNAYQSGAPGVVNKGVMRQLRKEWDDKFSKGVNWVTDDTIAGQAMQAASLGMEGVRDLDDLISRLKTEGAGPKSPLDKDWRSTLRREARAYYKDSLLFTANTQFVANYLSNKVTYYYEGWKSTNLTAAEFFFKKGESLPAGRSPINVGTDLVQNLLESNWKSIKAHMIVGELTDDVMRRATQEALGDAMPTGLLANYRAKWKELIQKGIYEGRTPFGDAAEGGMDIDVNTGFSRTRDDEYRIANQVLYGESGSPQIADSPVTSSVLNMVSEMRATPQEIPFILRDRVFLGTRIMLNHVLEAGIKKVTGKDVRLPLTSALQTLAAVDSRAGARTYLAVRAKDLMLETFERESDLGKLSWEARKEEISKRLQDEIYSADPSEAQIKSYREQFGTPNATDQAVRARIIARHVGAPVLDGEDKLAALQFSRRIRMQTPPETKWVQRLDQGIQELRKNSYVDAALPFWRSGMSSVSYMMEELAMPIKSTAEWFGREVVPGESQAAAKAKLMAGWVSYIQLVSAVGVMRGLGAIASSPAPGEDSKQWRLRYRGNSILNVPGLASIPLVGLIMTIDAAFDVVEKGLASKYDQIDLFQGLGQVFLGQVYRGAGFGQVREMVDAAASGDPKRMERLMQFLLAGQANPASGITRQLERGVGFQAGTGMNERFTDTWLTTKDYYLFDRMKAMGGEWEVRANDLPGYDLLDRALGFLRGALGGNASGLPIMETDYLGRDLRTPAGWFKGGEWPIGFPGVYDGRVHNILLEIGMLRPPSQLVTGRMDGLPMSAPLKAEFNQVLAGIPGGKFSKHPDFDEAAYLRIRGGTANEVTGEIRPYERSVSMAEFYDQLTEGRTLHGALNALFQSETWQQWMRDPEMTLVPSKSTDPIAADAPKADLRNRFPAKVVQNLHRYYGTLAEEEVASSASKAAGDWRALRAARDASMFSPTQVREQVREARGYANGLMTAP